MNRSLLFQVTALMASFTLLVALLMLYVLPSRQAAVLEAVCAMSLRVLLRPIQCPLGLEQQDLSMEELSEQVSFDGRNGCYGRNTVKRREILLFSRRLGKS